MRWIPLGLVPMLGLLGACGYSMRRLTPPGVRTVAVEVIENPTFRRDIEFQLTEDLKNAILSRTDLLVVDKNRADLLLSGTILQFREQVLAENLEDDIVQSSVIVTVEFVLTDRRTGKERDRDRITDVSEFGVGRNEDLGSATSEAFSDLAEKVIYRFLEEPF
jgi:hypothetical protein